MFFYLLLFYLSEYGRWSNSSFCVNNAWTGVGGVSIGDSTYKYVETTYTYIYSY